MIMKIAIIINHFPPKWLAGTEIATCYIAEHLAQRGHEVHVITSLDEGLPKKNIEKNFYIHRLPWAKIRFVGIFIFWINIVRTIRKISPDIVHAQSLISGMPALSSNRLLKIPYVVYGRGSDVYLPNWFTRVTINKVLKNASAVIALTEHMKITMQTMYKRDVVVVPNGISPVRDAGRERKKGDPTKRILFVGRLHPIKGTQYLLNAMSRVHKEIPDARLILVGDGEEREVLEGLTESLGLRKCVGFTGKIPHKKVQYFMNQAEVFVLPSLSEGFPVTILEAMACGLPIVATRVGGIPDIIEDKINGYLVDPKDQDQMADVLLKLLQDEELRKNISSNNRIKAEKYTWDKVAVTLEGLYQSSLRSL